MAANRPVGTRIMIGWISRASMASFISRASTFLPRYSGVRPTIRPGQEDADDQVDQHVDQADALAAEDAVEPHAGQRRQAGQRIEAVVHAVDRAAGDGGGDGREGRAGRGAEAQLLAFEVAQLLIDRQAGNGGDRLRCGSSRGILDVRARVLLGRSGRGWAACVSQ